MAIPRDPGGSPRPGSPRKTVALATCARLPDLAPDERAVIAPLAERGITAVPVVWDEPSVAWESFDAVVVRSTWDYSWRHEEFLRWARSVPNLCNPADVLAWNTDKHRYLRDLADAGLPVVPTVWVESGSTVTLPSQGVHVVKPAVGSGARHTGRYDLGDPRERALAAGLAANLTASGRTVMVQPYLDAVDTAGESALLFFGGRYSHAVRKSALLRGPADHGADVLAAESIVARDATDAELHLAQRVLCAVPGGIRRLLYARVDLLPGADGTPVVLELELAEPSLFLGRTQQAAERFAAAIAARLDG
ncbi:hypothetical protein LO772_04400 [Yinghuangia sp. ASG 101]|uniref:ATP-grasp domain-containing protein n=1 Tax=Yinghuangia sp. ASG 101 TaxID=2896848 RepID=UPI001E2CA6D2|nr:hypothetical protein [Yinghuangia sp. ASG 101]UGQ12867.1 hypothetical protein LO772_04400 [Yinghuangia sp. ASG 101]